MRCYINRVETKGKCTGRKLFLYPHQGVDGHVFTLDHTWARQEGAGMESFVCPIQGVNRQMVPGLTKETLATRGRRSLAPRRGGQLAPAEFSEKSTKAPFREMVTLHNSRPQEASHQAYFPPNPSSEGKVSQRASSMPTGEGLRQPCTM